MYSHMFACMYIIIYVYQATRAWTQPHLLCVVFGNFLRSVAAVPAFLVLLWDSIRYNVTKVLKALCDLESEGPCPVSVRDEDRCVEVYADHHNLIKLAST